MGVLIRPYGFTQSDSSDTQFPGGLEGDGGCNEHELGQILGDGEGQGDLVCCSPWGCKALDTTGRLTTAIRLVYSDNESLEKESLKSERNVSVKSSRRQKEMVSLTVLGWIVGVERVKDRSLWVGSRWQAPLKGRGGGGLLEQELKREG